MTCHRVCNKSNTTVAICRAEIVYPSEASPVFSWVHVARPLVFCVVFILRLFVLFLQAIAMYVVRFTAFHYPFGITSFLILFGFPISWIYVILGLVSSTAIF
jgi:hypothetical protein